MEVTRPLLNYYGGKWNLAEWIIGHFPTHEMYIEVFGGALSVFMKKPQSKAEVVNDLNKGKCILSGYNSEKYDSLKWEKIQISARTNADNRTECLWLCPRTSAEQTQGKFAL